MLLRGMFSQTGTHRRRFKTFKLTKKLFIKQIKVFFFGESSECFYNEESRPDIGSHSLKVAKYVYERLKWRPLLNVERDF